MPDINIKGTIISSDEAWIYDWLGIENVTPKVVHDAIAKANGEKLDVYVNSGGGDIFAASEIYESLRSYKGDVKIHVVGLAASAASVIACARESEIAPTAMFMVHNVSSYAEGDYRDMNHQAEVLENYSKIVKPGGKLVYATCSVLPSENQEQIKHFLSTEIGKEFTFVKDQKVLASESGFDGFYMALLERKNK